jgi:UDP-N-acetylmuramate: L-alanyl-gamma-D-glutamyl-meso-diaminopimelate ligase
VHLIGICGTAMATLAAMLKRKGLDVRGSDADVYPPMSDFLAGEGIPVFNGYRAEQITQDLDLVIVGNAISRGNAELEEVLDRKIRYCSLPEAIREHFLWGARSIVIAGTHGKTPIPRCSSAASPGTSARAARAIAWGRGGTSSSKATSTTARSSTRRQNS